MNKWKGWIIKKQYYKVEVEADTWAEAKDKIREVDINDLAQDGATEFDIYDIEEVAKSE
jgi:hypothetical protein